jgi:hypothetical protein
LGDLGAYRDYCSISLIHFKNSDIFRNDMILRRFAQPFSPQAELITQLPRSLKNNKSTLMAQQINQLAKPLKVKHELRSEYG